MEFCALCKQLDISLSGFLSHPGTDDNPRLKCPVYLLGNLEEISAKRQSCPLCQLIFSAFRSGPLKKIASVTDLCSLAIWGVWINALGPSKEQRLKSTALSILLWAESPHIAQGVYKVVIRARSRVLPDQPHFGRFPATTSLDFGLIGRWLKHCEKSHHSCCAISTSISPTKNFFLIDVKAKCIVRAPEHSRYLALSYVWGDVIQLQLSEENFNVLTRKNSLKDMALAATIKDAIELTAKLGERYLWVDALCIVQNSDLIRQQTIQDMDRIYANSILTIVAATCTSADDPLSGIGRSRTRTQWSQTISPSLSLTAHFDFKDFLEGSKYSERAWTFQEYQLATRLLIFTSNDQVFFSCREATYSEEVVPGKQYDSDVAMLEGASLIKLRPDAEHLWTTYCRGVETFTSRKMKYEGDVLNAFSGILRMICNDRTLEGLPSPIFELALLWQPSERLRRRDGFCSWSWAGWVGKCHWIDDQTLVSSRDDSRFKQDEVNAWIKARSWIVWYSSWGANTRSPAYRIEGPSWLGGSAPTESEHERRFPGQPRNFMPTPSLLPRRLDRLEMQKRHIRYLQFWTISAYFFVDSDPQAVVRSVSSNPENTGTSLRLFILRDMSKRNCGWVLLDEGLVEPVAGTNYHLHEFIMLSEGSLRYGLRPNDRPTDPSPENGCQEYNAMMITWTGGIAERAGLGRVAKHALPRSCVRPMRWKEILLG